MQRPKSSVAWVLAGHTAVVMVDGCSGAMALSHVEPTGRLAA